MVKKSVIGRNCNIGDKVKIINSVLFDNITVVEGSIIQGSIICSNVKILQKSEIKDTVIEHGQEISTPSLSYTLTHGSNYISLSSAFI